MPLDAAGVAELDVRVAAAIQRLERRIRAGELYIKHAQKHRTGDRDPLVLGAGSNVVTVRKNSGANVGTRGRLNLIEGSNVTLTVADDTTDNEVDITIAAAGGGGAALTVQEEDGAPSDAAVTKIRVPNGSLVVNLAGDVSLQYPLTSHTHTHAATTGQTADDHHAQAHKTAHASGGGDALYSYHNYVFAPDAAPAATVTAGDQQGNIYHSGPNAETADKLYVDAETAPGASGLPITIQYGDTDDLDTVALWTTIATLTLSSAKSDATTAMTNATIPASRLIRMNVGTIVGTPKDVTVSLRVKRPLST